MDWETLYCPNRCCRFYGMPFGHSALIKNGASRGHKQALCQSCGRSVFLRYGTAYFELEADPSVFETAIRALAEGNSLRSTARIVGSVPQYPWWVSSKGGNRCSISDRRSRNAAGTR